MRKFIMILFSVLIVGGAAYFFYGNIDEAETAVGNEFEQDIKTEKETIKNEDLDVRTGIPIDKIWEYSFDKPLDEETLTDKNISIVDDQNKNVSINFILKNEGKTLLINPPLEGYEKGESYELNIKKDMKYKNGSNVSRSYRMKFITVRDEVEKAVLNPKIKKIDEEKVKFLENNELKIKKNATKEAIIVDDIIIVPSLEHPEGQALKVTSVKGKFTSYIVKVTVPEFTEIYEELDVNKTYPITEDNFTPEKGIEGLSVTSVALGQTPNMVAGTNTTEESEKKYEFKEPSINVKINKGIQVNFNDFIFDKKSQVGANGTLTLFSPEVKVDFKTKLLKINRMELSTTTKAKTDISFNRTEKKAQKIKILKAKKIPDSIKIGKINIPTTIPGLIIQGNLTLNITYGISGEAKLWVSIDKEEVNGFLYENSKFNNISDVNSTSELGIHGKGKVEGKVGPAFNILATAFGVVGAGLEGYAGVDFTGEAAAGTDTVIGKYACGKLGYGASANASAIINTPKGKLAEYVLAEHPIGRKSIYNDCEVVTDLSKVEPMNLSAEESKNVEIMSIMYNILNLKKSDKQANMKNIKITVSPKKVVTVTKGKKGIIVKALQYPEKEKATITLTQTIDKKKQTLEIPISINNFKQLQEEKKAQEEKEAAKNLSLLNAIPEFAEFDEDIRILLGKNYKTLVENMQSIEWSMEKYGLEETIAVEGGVNNTLMKSIILVDPFYHYYIANIDEGKVKVYTNDSIYKESLGTEHGLTALIDRWREPFSDYPVEYKYKKINGEHEGKDRFGSM
ncbi:Ig-like domain-containing protein [Peribacillus sp. NPDC046944]|uniref:Ig-like domain-containing protein n=1 Tax=unclassified Peribacillus TaxID=2675266 RepID=UPI003CFF9BC7